MSQSSVAAYVIVLVLLTGTLAGVRLSDNRPLDALESPLETISEELAGWRVSSTATLSPGQMRALRPSSYLARTYHKDGIDVPTLVAYYAVQRAGESMHSPKGCLPGEGWEIWDTGAESVIFDGHPVEINRYSIRNAANRLVVLYWYQSRKRIVANEYAGKILLMRDAVVDGRTAGSLVRIILPDTGKLEQDKLQFAADLMTEVQRCLGR